jgi:hypothetical protein
MFRVGDSLSRADDVAEREDIMGQSIGGCEWLYGEASSIRLIGLNVRTPSVTSVRIN